MTRPLSILLSCLLLALPVLAGVQFNRNAYGKRGTATTNSLEQVQFDLPKPGDIQP